MRLMMASQSGSNDAGSSGNGIPSELRARDLPSKRLLGKGLASIVYETEWNGEMFARKDFIGVPSGAFQKEAAILVGLEDHENVVKTHGRTVDKMSCSLVLEYMDEDLLDVLQKRKESERGACGTAYGSRCERNPSYPFELSEALAILSQIARGMEFLHEQNIPHGDLKTKNILISHIIAGDENSLLVKVADFGLVRTKSKSMSFVSRQARKLDAVHWKAPEVLERLLSEDNDVTSSESDSNSDSERAGTLGVNDRLGADVYSFAVTCSQILTGEGPYPNGHWKELGPRIVSEDLRPSLPASCPVLLKSLLESCWTKSPARRPTFSFIRELLDFWLADLKILQILDVSYDAGITPKSVSNIPWDDLENMIRIWTHHLEGIVKVLGAGERRLSGQVFKHLGDLVWVERLRDLAEPEMNALIQFGESVVGSRRSPEMLCKLLEMFECLEKCESGVIRVFDGQACAQIRSRYRELLKQVIYASGKTFWNIGRCVRKHREGAPQDGKVMKLCSWVVNYLKYLLAFFPEALSKVLRITGSLGEGNRLAQGIAQIFRALEEVVEARAEELRDPALRHIFLMNNMYYFHNRVNNSDLEPLLGEEMMSEFDRKVSQIALEYEREGWQTVLQHLHRQGPLGLSDGEYSRKLVRRKLRAFKEAFDATIRRHAKWIIPEQNLRDRTIAGIIQIVVPAYRRLHGALDRPRVDKMCEIAVFDKYAPELVEIKLKGLFNPDGGSCADLPRRL